MKIISIIAAVGVLTSSLYYLLCIWGAVKFLSEAKIATPKPGPRNIGSASGDFRPPVSILKPLKGIDPEMYESFRSHCLQDYPEYEILFGVSEPDDPAIERVGDLQRNFPDRNIRLIHCPAILGANVKVSNLAQMLPKARYEYVIVNDSDIRVEPGYVRRVVSPLIDPCLGLVTCLYRAISAPTFGSRLEALGISTDFSPSVLAARQLEHGIRFGLGSTLCFRRADLEKLGGFNSLLDYLADDYELGKRFADLGLQVELSDVVVETFLPDYSFRNFVAHQLRWARGIRDVRGTGYLGLIFTFGVFWSLIALAASKAAPWSWVGLAVILLLRTAGAFLVGGRILRQRQLVSDFWLIPFRDLIAVAIWVASFAGNTVTWRGQRFNLKDGKLSRIPQ